MTGTAESTAGNTAAAATEIPRLVRTAAELGALSRPYGPHDASWKRATVMTMGALHAGHAALIRAARERLGPRGQVVVTVFVNPLQFGPSEDLDRYPRTLDADLLVARDAGADVVFAPSADEVYPDGEPHVRIAAGAMGERFEGAYRHGHFDGVLTVVAKLLHLTAPDFACFGQKDAQQLAMIRRMVRDLNFPVEIIGVPTVREPDGLALSSRNRYLSADGRECALALSRGLFAARDAAPYGPDAALAAARDVLDAAAHREPSFTVDYLALIDPTDFTELTGRTEGDGAGNGTGTAAEPADAVLAVAARVGGTRLIDNVLLSLGAPR